MTRKSIAVLLVLFGCGAVISPSTSRAEDADHILQAVDVLDFVAYKDEWISSHRMPPNAVVRIIGDALCMSPEYCTLLDRGGKSLIGVTFSLDHVPSERKKELFQCDIVVYKCLISFEVPVLLKTGEIVHPSEVSFANIKN